MTSDQDKLKAFLRGRIPLHVKCAKANMVADVKEFVYKNCMEFDYDRVRDLVEGVWTSEVEGKSKKPPEEED